MQRESLPAGMRSTLATAAVLASLAASQPVLACASCGCTLSKDWLGPQAGSVSGWAVSLSYDYLNQDQMRIGTHNLDRAGAEALLNPPANTGNEVELQTATRTTTLAIDYNTPTWGVNVQVPYLDKYHTTLSDGTDAGYDVAQFRDLGDVRITGKYGGWSSDGGSGLTMGLVLPTGATNENFQSGDAVDPSLQPGTGTTQLLVGAFTSGMQGKLGWFVQGTWQHALDAHNDYRPGNAILVNAGLRYAEPGQAVVPLLQINLVHRNSDSGLNASYAYDGSPQTGGDLAYLAPGVAASLGEGITGYAYVQLPIYQDVTGVQLTPRYILSLGLRKAF